MQARNPESIEQRFAPFREKMERAGVGEVAIRAFACSFATLVEGGNRMIAEEEIGAVETLAAHEEVERPLYGAGSRALFDQTVVIKLNGGLGTGMGLRKAKSLLEVRDGHNFLDLIVQQIEHIRRESGADVRLMLMNSFSTSADTLAHLATHARAGRAAAGEVELMQNRVPKIEEETLRPVSWPAEPELEWCPPGHGDLYTALVGSGWLDRLLAEGRKYAFVSNSDNLGAMLEPGLLERFAESGAEFLMEVTRRTASDRKGGHLAVRKGDGRLILRELAQCPPADLDAFQDVARHRYFNTNSLWLRLEALREAVAHAGGFLPLPVICNRKPVDPRDPDSTPVIQLETATGAAIQTFANARAVEVTRRRFAPVKSTADLFALRSDAYQLTDEGRMQLAPERENVPPVVRLSDDYKLVDSLDRLGIPSLKGAASLTVEGAVRFEPGAAIEGEVVLSNSSPQPLAIDRLVRDEELRNT